MPRTAKAENVVTMYSDREAVLIARALHEAADRHVHGYDPEFREDAEVGREMRALLNYRFPDALEAYDRAETLKQAIAAGFLPPPDDALILAAKVYVCERRAAQEAAKAAACSKQQVPTYQPRSDIPF